MSINDTFINIEELRKKTYTFITIGIEVIDTPTIIEKKNTIL